MRHLVTIQKIDEIQPIENADAIEKAKIKDWWVVVKKEQFKLGDLCIYFEIDSFLPIRPEFEFLLKGTSPKKLLVNGEIREGIRLKTIKLRGQISQGLVLPLQDNLPKEVGVDITELMGVVKYELPIPVHMSGEVKGDFPSFLPKTDEERIQNCGELLNLYKGLKCYVSSKLDGTSATFYKYNDEFGVCSRNLELKEGGTIYWRIAQELELQQKLPDLFCIQGEIVGEGIQKNPLKISKQKFYIFNVYDIKKACYLNYVEFKKFVEEMGLETVPILNDCFELNHSVEELLSIASAKSPLNPNELQEGIVIRPLIEQNAAIAGVLARLSFKVISNEYLLKHEE